MCRRRSRFLEMFQTLSLRKFTYFLRRQPEKLDKFHNLSGRRRWRIENEKKKERKNKEREKKKKTEKLSSSSNSCARTFIMSAEFLPLALSLCPIMKPIGKTERAKVGAQFQTSQP